ncbi:efflux RND transporter periplasmic adaptor subunit [sulfur-oxidizing endosymbiont of Gigantopelta aegis]|uniref:efflux RND transporter periplasmic adaptor subunit n=1 Tax=sulfur-oxidizing endosymbiont of Gigantopelta aegis TaxID=2794934 RepID=UPI001BE41685|nr:efflux RND transporter periplasmic adaptor subunit [sulfur-oxidizing endosymbiont of Gigantopelta aegis]
MSKYGCFYTKISTPLFIGLSFSPGSFFKKGELLAVIDPKEYEVEILKAKAKVAQSRQRLYSLRQESQVRLEDWQALRGNTTDIPNDLILKKPQIAEAKANLQASMAELSDARLRRKRTEIRAPYTGRVMEKSIDLGQYVTAGQVVGHIYSIDKAEIRLPLSDSQLSFLNLPKSYILNNKVDHQEIKPTVTIHTVFAGKEYIWLGKVVRTEAGLDTKSRVQYVVAEVDDPYALRTENDKPPLEIGRFINAEIEGKLYKNVYVLPRQAVRQNNQVFVVLSDNTLELRTIELLRNERNRVLVSNGLASGDKIVVSPLDTAVGGMKVRTPDNFEG